ncbi:hypothetical protein D3C74_324910 [compost metagenome]
MGDDQGHDQGREHVRQDHPRSRGRLVREVRDAVGQEGRARGARRHLSRCPVPRVPRRGARRRGARDARAEPQAVVQCDLARAEDRDQPSEREAEAGRERRAGHRERGQGREDQRVRERATADAVRERREGEHQGRDETGARDAQRTGDLGEHGDHPSGT